MKQFFDAKDGASPLLLPGVCARTHCEFVGTALAIGLGVASAVGSIASSAIGAHAAGKAADTQAAAADKAAQLAHSDNMAALAYQKQKDTQQRSDLMPWMTAGSGAITQLYSDLKGGAYPDWTGKFQAPTGLTEQNDPGFQARLKLGEDAVEKGAAARGGLLTGGTARAMNQYAQDYASNEYGNVYARQWNEYMQRYNESMNNNTNRFNRFASIAGTGQTAATTSGQLGQQSAGNVANIYSGDAAQTGQAYMAAGNARASGYINQANAWNGAINGGMNSLLLYSMLRPGSQTSQSGMI